jgi:lipid-binding SYLF domain-containing protein
MSKPVQFTKLFVLYAFAALMFAGVRTAVAADESVLTKDAEAALQSLYTNTPAAETLGKKAVGILVFPKITRAAFIVGAQGGDGVLFEHGKVKGYYSSGALSVGLQAGAQSYGYALFFMTHKDLEYLHKSHGWSLGVGPNIVVVDAGAAKDVSTLTGQQGVYAFIFNQQGLMAGVGVVGQKITKLH